MWKIRRCIIVICSFFFFNDTATTEIYTLSLHDALPICALVIEVGYKGMGGKWRLVLLGGIERQCPHEHVAQRRVGHRLRHHVVDTSAQELGIEGFLGGGGAEAVESGSSCHPLYEVVVAGKIGLLVRKIGRHLA